MSKVKDIKSKGVKVMLNGKEYTLKYDLNSFAELEEYYGDVDKAMEDAEKGKIKALRAILWSGIIHAYLDEDGNPTIKPHEVGAMVGLEDLKNLFETMNESMKGALPESVEDEEKGEVDPIK